MSAEPSFESEKSEAGQWLRLRGSWTIENRALERAAKALAAAGARASHITIDVAGVDALDTAGAWVIDRSRTELARTGSEVELANAKPAHAILLQEAHYRVFDDASPARGLKLIDWLADIGMSVAQAGRDLVNGVAFFGQFVTALARLVINPMRMRGTSIVYHIENFAVRGLPIIALINFLVGCIVAQQGLFQLKRFGASTYTVDLIGLLTLRELGVLLTSIMIAGRSGSAITAEIGSMKMREEIDAMRVMGLDEIEVLIVPRLLALVISLPLLTFISDIAGLFGGIVVTWSYGGISPDVFMARLQGAIVLSTFTSGIIKAPFMALVIGMIAAIEGLAVEGSAEALGRRVTSSVVKSIFMVIVVDGLFAMFFAAIDF